jgi:transcriptional regulator with AAA-type ATPase domain
VFVVILLDDAGRSLTRPISTPTNIDLNAFRGLQYPGNSWIAVPSNSHVTLHTSEGSTLAVLHAGERVELPGISVSLTWIDEHATDQVVTAHHPMSLSLCAGNREAFALPRRSIVVGSSPLCDVYIDDPSISRRHCEITPLGEGWAVWDLGSTNGVRVDGIKTSYAVLEPGVTLTLGRVRVACSPVTVRKRDASPIVGASRAVETLRARIAEVADAPYSVLIEGESGVGKELVAREIHQLSARRDRPMVSINCGAIAPELVESELFGHERGAFSGATNRRRGVFEEAHEGTLFLDEIGELPLSLQPKLLRVLETGEIRRVGGEATQKVKVRVISATLRDLEANVANGHFREDLFFRLQDMRVRVPALRERVGDIPALATALLDRIGEETGRYRRLEDRALARLMLWRWPGNVRELFSVLKRAVFASHSPTLSAEQLDLVANPHLVAGSGVSDRPLKIWPEGIPEGDINALYQWCNGNLTRVSQITGVARSTVRARLAKHRAMT